MTHQLPDTLYYIYYKVRHSDTIVSKKPQKCLKMHKNGVLFGWIPKIFCRQIILLRKTKIDVFCSKVWFYVRFLSRKWRKVLVKITEYLELNFEDQVKYPKKIYYFVVWKWTKYAIFGRKSPTINSMNACTDTVTVDVCNSASAFTSSFGI